MNESGYLFATPSIWEGAGRIFDFGNTLTIYNVSRDGVEADWIAAARDWRAVGDDLRRAAQQMDAEPVSK